MSIPLPPIVRYRQPDLVYYGCTPGGLDLKAGGKCKGKRRAVPFFVLYGAEDTGARCRWLKYSLPFSEKWNVGLHGGNWIPLIEASVMHQSLRPKTDVDGEERILVPDIVLELI